MKNLLMLTTLTIGLLSLNARAATIPREDLRKTLEHVRELAHGLQGDLDAANAAKLALAAQITALEATLADTRATLTDTQARADSLQGEINKQAAALAAETDRADQEKAAKEKAQADLKHVLGKYHFLKLLGAALAAGLVFLLVWRFSPPLQGPWQLAVYIIPPVAAFAAFCALL